MLIIYQCNDNARLFHTIRVVFLFLHYDALYMLLEYVFQSMYIHNVFPKANPHTYHIVFYDMLFA